MSSDTPRIDRALQLSDGQWSFVLRDTAREIERELNQANERCKRLEVQLNGEWVPYREYKRTDLLLSEANERIKRLEQAGDAMVNGGWNEPHLAGAWRKAKEEA